MYMDATKASRTNNNQLRRRHRSPSPVCSSSSPEDTTQGRSKKRRREPHRSTDYNPLASLFPNGTNVKINEPEDDRNKLTIQYWKASQFDSKNVPAPKPYDTDDTYQPCARKYSYFKDSTGRPIAKSQLNQFRSYVTDLLVTLNNDHHELIEGKGFWRELSKGLKDAFWKELRVKFSFLHYCDDNWKGQKFIVDYYRCWYVSSVEKGQDATSNFKLEDDTGDVSTSPIERQKAMTSTTSPEPVFTAQIIRPM
jgi:hypothetical protein